jgi:hypothetical protein
MWRLIPNGTGVISRGLKRHGRETKCSPPPSEEVKNAWRRTSTAPYDCMASCLSGSIWLAVRWSVLFKNISIMKCLNKVFTTVVVLK